MTLMGWELRLKWIVWGAVLAVILFILGAQGAFGQSRPHIDSVGGIPSNNTFSGYSEIHVNSSDNASTTKVEFRWSRVCFPDLDDTSPDTGDWFYNFNASQCDDGPITLMIRMYDSQGQSDNRVYYNLQVANNGTPTPTAAPATATPVPPTATPVPPTATAVPQPGKALLDRYQLLQFNEGGTGELPHYNLTQYHPRQFSTGVVLPDQTWGPVTITNTGNYEGWDYMTFANQGISRTYQGNLVKITLNRPGRLAVLWTNDPNSLPSWLQSWTSAGTVSFSQGDSTGTYNVYTKDYSAGDVTLDASGGSSSAPREAYYLLMAESGGVPSDAPAQRGSPAALPNQTCPSWVHDQYVTTVDGVNYPTWHRQIDPEYWCYFRHDHGSDPSQFGDGSFHPAYGRSITDSGMTENHEGFKSFLVTNPVDGNRQYYGSMHFGIVNAMGAACNEHHEFGIAVWRNSDSVLESNVLAMTSFGHSVENTSLTHLHPTACPNGNPNPNIPTSNTGAREMPVYNGGNGNGNPVLYEPWRIFVGDSVLGYGSVMSMNTPDVYTVCLDLDCAQNVVVGGKGTTRFLNVVGGFGIRASLAGATGDFFTNAHGTSVVSGPADPAHKVRQYIRSDANANWTYLGDNHACGVYGDRFRALYSCNTNADRGEPVELEGALTMPN